MNGLNEFDDVILGLLRKTRGVNPDASYAPSPEMLAASAGGAEAIDAAQLPVLPEATSKTAMAAPDGVRRIRLPEMTLSTVPPELRGEGGEGMSALQAQLAGIMGPADAAGLDVGDEFNAFLQARGGNTLPGAAARVDAEAQKEATADVERAVAGASNTSRATSTDGDEDRPSRDDYTKRAMVQHLFNVGPALFGRRTQQVADPDAQYRADLAAWLNRKQQREATAAQQERQRRLDELAMLTEGRKAKELEAETAQKAGKEATEAEREKRRREEADREYELKKRADERAEAEAKRRATGAKQRATATARGGAPTGGKQLPTSVVSELAELPVAERQVDALVEAFRRLDMGGIGGKAGALATSALGLGGTKTAEYNAAAKLAMQAAGKIMEGGKLAAGDEVKYAAMLPKPGDSEAVVQQKAEGLKRFLRDLASTRAKGLKAAGYSVPEDVAPTDGGAVGVVKLRRGQEEAELHDATPRDIEDAKADGWEVLP